jgi:riboflavin biosynthesis pyrimidine reductase
MRLPRVYPIIDTATLERVAIAIPTAAASFLEGGAEVHAAAWDERLVDYVRLYVTPHVIGSAGIPLLADRTFSSAELQDRRVVPLGPDVLIEGYVHGTH